MKNDKTGQTKTFGTKKYDKTGQKKHGTKQKYQTEKRAQRCPRGVEAKNPEKVGGP